MDSPIIQVKDVQLLGSRVLLKAKVERKEKQTSSGIIVDLDNHDYDATIATVLAFGPEVQDLKVGDKVVIIPSYLLSVNFNIEDFGCEEGYKYYHCEHEDIFGKI